MTEYVITEEQAIEYSLRHAEMNSADTDGIGTVHMRAREFQESLHSLESHDVEVRKDILKLVTTVELLGELRKRGSDVITIGEYEDFFATYGRMRSSTRKYIRLEAPAIVLVVREP